MKEYEDMTKDELKREYSNICSQLTLFNALADQEMENDGGISNELFDDIEELKTKKNDLERLIG